MKRPVLRPLSVTLPPEVRELLAPYPGENPAAVIVRALRLLRLADKGASAARARGGETAMTTVEQLLLIVDRAERGSMLAEEAVLLRAGIRQLAAEARSYPPVVSLTASNPLSGPGVPIHPEQPSERGYDSEKRQK